MGRWLFAVSVSLLGGALAALPVLLLSLLRKPLGIALALPVFCAVSALAAPFAAPNTKEAQSQRLVCAVSAALAALASTALARPYGVAGAALSVAAALGVLTRSRFRAPAEFVSLRKPPTSKGL